ncbi:MAG: hypothetical protein ABI668_04325 [Sphingorhabdus sp.]
MIAPLFSTRPVRLMEIDSRDASLILAARSCLILRRARQYPLPRLRGYLFSQVMAMRFALLMDVVQQIWPEPFGIHRPCCPTASIDEALLSHAVQYASLDARPAFDVLLHEMLGNEARDLLYTRARNLSGNIDFPDQGNIR